MLDLKSYNYSVGQATAASTDAEPFLGPALLGFFTPFMLASLDTIPEKDKRPWWGSVLGAILSIKIEFTEKTK